MLKKCLKSATPKDFPSEDKCQYELRFCRSNDFFAYPNNYNYYVNYYKNTFQHGGISMNEMLIPVAYLKSK